MQVDSESYVMRFDAPQFLTGSAYVKIAEEGLYGLKLIAATRPKQKTNLIGLKVEETEPIDIADAEATVIEGDQLLCFGRKSDFRNLYKYIEAI